MGFNWKWLFLGFCLSYHLNLGLDNIVDFKQIDVKNNKIMSPYHIIDQIVI